MAKYAKKSQDEVEKAVHKYKRDQQHSGPGEKNKAQSRKQAIAIGYSRARKKGAKVPKKS